MTCLQRKIWAKCKCLDEKLALPFLEESTKCGSYTKYAEMIAFPDKYNRSHCFSSENMTSVKECEEMFEKLFNGLLCVRKVKENPLLDSNKFKCHCPDACDTFKFEMSYSLAGWLSDGPELDEAYRKIVQDIVIPKFGNDGEEEDTHTGQYKLILRNVINYLNDSSKKREIMSNFLRLTVYIEDLAVETIEDVAEYSKVDLLSDIGQCIHSDSYSFDTFSNSNDPNCKCSPIGLQISALKK